MPFQSSTQTPNFASRRWVYYTFAIILGVLTVFILFMRESRPSLLLDREVQELCQKNGIQGVRAINPDSMPDLRTFIQAAFLRPFQFFFREPLIFSVSMMAAVAFALLFVFTEAVQPIYKDLGLLGCQGSLPFLAIGVGLGLSAVTRIFDDRSFELHRRRNQCVKPEGKLLGFFLGAPALAIALWWFAWTIPPAVSDIHWIVPSIALVLVGYALNEFDTVLLGYIVDSYLTYSASALAAIQFIRAVMAGTFPLFTHQMLDILGANVTMTVLAVVATIFCATPPVFACYGERVRQRSKFARESPKIVNQLGMENGEIGSF
jgi:hypothetical protein